MRVGYHLERHDPGLRYSKEAQMREALFECGYVSPRNDVIYIECETP